MGDVQLKESHSRREGEIQFPPPRAHPLASFISGLCISPLVFGFLVVVWFCGIYFLLFALSAFSQGPIVVLIVNLLPPVLGIAFIGRWLANVVRVGKHRAMPFYAGLLLGIGVLIGASAVMCVPRFAAFRGDFAGLK